MSKGEGKPAFAVISAGDFEPPAVEVGQVVLWSYAAGGQSRQSPAVVLSVGTRTLNLAVHVDGMHDHLIKTGVRYCEDPFLKTAPQHDSGVWDRTSRDRRVDALLARFEGDDE